MFPKEIILFNLIRNFVILCLTRDHAVATVDMEAIPHTDTAKSGAVSSDPSLEPKRSAGAADKTVKSNSKKGATAKSKHATGQEKKSDGKGKIPSPKMAMDSNKELAQRMEIMEKQLALIAAALPPVRDSVPTTSVVHDCEQRGGEYMAEIDETCHDIASTERDFYMHEGGETEEGGDDNDYTACINAQEIPLLAAKFAAPSGVGEPVDRVLANSTAYLIAHPLEEKMLEDTTAKYPAPSNCPSLDTPKVNAPIWDHLPQPTRSRDVKLQRVQKSLTKGLSALIHSFPTPQLNDTQQDALALLCNANYELNCLRKELIKPDMAATYSHLCKPNTPVTKFLFGDDLGKRMKDMKEEQRAASGAVKSTKPFARSPYHPYARGAGYFKRQFQNAGWTSSNRASAGRPSGGGSSKPFLGQRTQWGHKQPPPHTLSRPPQMQHRGASQRKK